MCLRGSLAQEMLVLAGGCGKLETHATMPTTSEGRPRASRLPRMLQWAWSVLLALQDRSLKPSSHASTSQCRGIRSRPRRQLKLRLKRRPKRRPKRRHKRRLEHRLQPRHRGRLRRRHLHRRQEAATVWSGGSVAGRDGLVPLAASLVLSARCRMRGGSTSVCLLQIQIGRRWRAFAKCDPSPLRAEHAGHAHRVP